MNAKSKWRIGLDEIVTDDFRTGHCVCGIHVQGNDAIWREHRRIIHTADGRIDIGMTPGW